jgi:hypothetical protein
MKTFFGECNVWLNLRLPQQKLLSMSEHHEHHEAEQNEIAGPVIFTLMCVTIAVLIIYFWAK